MRFLGFEITRAEKRSIENPALPLGSITSWNEFFGLAASSDAGVTVTTESALGVASVWAAVNFLSSTLASLPLRLFVKKGDAAQPASSDPLYRILHDAPNPELSSYKWRSQAMMAACTTGRSFTFIERNAAGRVAALWPLDPSAVTVERVAGRLRYRVRTETVSGQSEVVYAAGEIIDIPFALAADGLSHYSPIATLRNAIGLAIAMERYGARFFSNGGVPPLQLVGPFQSPAGAERAGFDVAAAIRAAKSRQSNVLPLPLGHELKAIGTDPEKSQMSEARRFQLEEIARIYNIPPGFLHDLTRATFSNQEQAATALVKHSIAPWCKVWESELDLKLFGADRRRYVRFNLDGLLRGDMAARMAAHATAITNGIRTPNECRDLEELPPMGGNADKLFIQGATTPLDQPLAASPRDTTPNPHFEVEEDQDDD